MPILCLNLVLMNYTIALNNRINGLYKGAPAILAKNIWHKLKKYSKIGQGFKNVISNFACFLTAIASIWFLEGRLGAGLRLHSHFTFFWYFLISC